MKVQLTSEQKAEKADLLERGRKLRLHAQAEIRKSGLGIPTGPPGIPEVLQGVVEPSPDGGIPTVPADTTALTLHQVGALYAYWLACMDFYKWRGVQFDTRYEVHREMLVLLVEMLHNFYSRVLPDASAEEVKRAIRTDPDYVALRLELLGSKLANRMAQDRLKQLDRVRQGLSRELARRDTEVRGKEAEAGLLGGGGGKPRVSGPDRRRRMARALGKGTP